MPALPAPGGLLRGVWKPRAAGAALVRALKHGLAALAVRGAAGLAAQVTAILAAMETLAHQVTVVPAGRVPVAPIVLSTALVPLFPPPAAAGLLPVMPRIADKPPLVPVHTIWLLQPPAAAATLPAGDIRKAVLLVGLVLRPLAQRPIPVAFIPTVPRLPAATTPAAVLKL